MILLMVYAALGYIVFSALGIAVALFYFDLPLSELGDTQNYRSIQALKWVQVCNTAGTFLIPALIIRLHKQQTPLFSLRFNKPDISLLILSGAAMVLLLPAVSGLAALNESLHFPDFLKGFESYLRAAELKAQTITEAFLDMHTPMELLGNLLLVAVWAALCEELFFRGAMQPILFRQTGNIHIAVWSTAALFSAFHFQFFGFIPRLILGAILGYMAHYGRSLWYAVWAHFINNGISVLAYYLILQGFIDAEWKEFGSQPGDIFSAVLGGAAALGLFYFALFNRGVDTAERQTL
jgi:membrane protease YdiL (CAAX protease family)